ncbi:major facilitator superfamily domain-containing protein 9-like isoform X1 [Neodiprion virginianus]|uniref:major facilitator superfamily domain-containing protein 9-like isoform X1 n=1 Tax=Neodiprion virginianus TaxID=2961670 RepID=UPI001EE6E0B7|nr:major facilitator superfamily domain-containing protein 9-like isoform X1 [Neodiprion virginianus]
MKFNPTWVYVVSFVDLFAVSLSIPLLSTHLRALGASHIVIGFFSSLYAGTQLISGPIIGSWSDQKGRQAILLISLTISAISYIFLGIVKSLWVILIIRAGLGTFKHIQVLARTIVADRVLPEEQSKISGRLTALSSAGFIVGPAIGGHLAELEHGFSYLCYCTALLFAVNIGTTYFFLYDPPETGSPDETKTSLKKKQYLSIREQMLCVVRHLVNVDWIIYGDVFALKFLMAVSNAIFTSNYFANVQETYNISPRWAGYTISFQGLIASLAGLLAGWIDQKFYKNDLTFQQRNLHGFIIITISYVGLFTAPTLHLFMLSIVPLTAASSLVRIVGMDMVLKRCSPTQRGSLVGTSNSISNIARFVAPLLAGLMGDLYGTRSATLLCILLSSLGIIVSLMVRQYKPIQLKVD